MYQTTGHVFFRCHSPPSDYGLIPIPFFALPICARAFPCVIGMPTRSTAGFVSHLDTQRPVTSLQTYILAHSLFTLKSSRPSERLYFDASTHNADP